MLIQQCGVIAGKAVLKNTQSGEKISCSRFACVRHSFLSATGFSSRHLGAFNEPQHVTNCFKVSQSPHGFASLDSALTGFPSMDSFSPCTSGFPLRCLRPSGFSAMIAALFFAFDGRCLALLFCTFRHRTAPNAANFAAKDEKILFHHRFLTGLHEP